MASPEKTPDDSMHAAEEPTSEIPSRLALIDERLQALAREGEVVYFEPVVRVDTYDNLVPQENVTYHIGLTSQPPSGIGDEDRWLIREAARIGKLIGIETGGGYGSGDFQFGACNTSETLVSRTLRIEDVIVRADISEAMRVELEMTPLVEELDIVRNVVVRVYGDGFTAGLAHKVDRGELDMKGVRSARNRAEFPRTTRLFDRLNPRRRPQA